MNKSQAQTAHAKRRLAQRYDLHLTRADLAAMSKAIRDGLAIFVERQSLRVSIHDVDVDGTTVRVVYDRKRKTIVTALPKEPE